MIIIKKKLSNVALALPEILIPSNGVDLSKWSVIACDQYTSDKKYWENAENFVGSSPSSLNVILPEAYLDDSNNKKGPDSIIKEMKSYLRNGTLRHLEPGYIYTKRTTGYGNERNGLMVMVDLEKYSYLEGNATLIRPTEKTIIDRIPPRIKIRERAPFEIPHILFLIDDPDKTVIEPLEKMKNLFNKLYDFSLMMDGGKVEGYHITEEKALSSIANALAELADADTFHERYGDEHPVMLYAVGDGNHSLAAAKQHWENIKQSENLCTDSQHPARYAMVELINIHDEGMKFEPIHRLIFDCPIAEILNSLKAEFDIETQVFDDVNSLIELVEYEYSNKQSHTYGVVSDGDIMSLTIKTPDCNLAVSTIQAFIDRFLVDKNCEIDFIHDVESTVALANEKNTAILLPSIDKEGFFRTIIEEGTLPRKAFSMGHADEKRFYMEARKIID